MSRRSYRVEIAPAAGRDLRKLERSAFGAAQSVILSLAIAPRPPGTRKLKGSDRTFRIRLGPYRVLYDVYDNEKLVVVFRVVRRKEATYRRS